jgi:hypothetical protein
MCVKAEAHLIAAATGKPPEGQASWTLRLLRDYMVKVGYVERASLNASSRYGPSAGIVILKGR